MNKQSVFPWHYYIRTVRSRIFFVLSSVFLTYSIISYYQESAFVRIISLVLVLIIIAFIYGYFRTLPLQKILDEIEKLQVQLPHDKKLNIIYQQNEWALLEEMLKVTEHYISKQNETLQAQLSQNNVLLESIPNAVVVIDRHETCLQFNHVFRNKFMLDHPITDSIKIWKVFENSELLEKFRKAFKKQKRLSISAFHFSHLDEYYDIAISPIKNSEGETSSLLAIFHNVTDSKLTEKMRVDFVANVSHEIRTPLTSIKGYTQLMQAYDKELPEQFHPIMQKIDHNADRLKDLFDNLLNLSVIESRYELEKVEVPLKELLLKIQSNLKAKYLDKAIEFRNHLSQVKLFGDRKLIEQVFTNLLDNSIKYGNENIEIQVHSSMAKENSTQIDIYDNGPGISADELKRIFERFYRVQGNQSKVVEGTGLGLSIVKHIINKHKAQISVDSEIGKGTHFKLIFPQ